MATDAQAMLERLRREQGGPTATPEQQLSPAAQMLADLRQEQGGPTVAPAQPEQPAEDGDRGDFLRGLTQNIAQGITLGFGDEIVAGLTAPIAAISQGVPVSEAFRDILEAERFGTEQFAEQRPVAATAAQIVGGLATGGAGASRAAGAKVFQGATTRAGRIAQRTGAAAAAGVPIGAVFGAGTAEGGLQERAVGAAEGAAIGAVGGAALRPVIAGATGALKLGAKGLRGVSRALTKTEADQANLQIARSLQRDDVIGTARQSIQKLGPGATIADAAGESTLLELERVASSPASRNTVVKAITERLNGQRSRIASDVREIFTPQTRTFQEQIETITTEASRKAAPLYAKAYAADVDNSAGALKKLLSNPRIREAVNAGVKNVKSKTIDPADPNADVLLRLQAGADADNPNLMVWDHAKRALDDLQGKALNSGQRSLARDIAGNLKALRTVLDKKVPTYGQARAVWAGGKEAEEAFRSGTRILDRLTNLEEGADESIKLFDELSDAGKQLYRTGVGQRLENILNTAPEALDGTPGASLIKQIAGSPEKRRVLANAIPDETVRKQFFKSLQLERESVKRSGEVLRNSRTELRRALKNESQASMRGVVSNLVAGQFALSGNQFAQLRLVSSIFGKVGTLPPGVNRQVAEKLVETRGTEIQRTLNEIDRLIRIPKSLKEATNLSPSDTVKFFLDNPDAARKFNETASAITAAVAADKRNRQ